MGITLVTLFLTLNRFMSTDRENGSSQHYTIIQWVGSLTKRDSLVIRDCPQVLFLLFSEFEEINFYFF